MNQISSGKVIVVFLSLIAWAPADQRCLKSLVPPPTIFPDEGFVLDCDDGFMGTILCLGANVSPNLENDVDLLAYALAGVAFSVALEAAKQGDLELQTSARQGLKNLADLLQNPLRGHAVSLQRKVPFDVMRFALIDMRGAADLASDFTPGVSVVKDLVIVTTGINPVTQEQVSEVEKTIRIGCLVLPGLVGGASRKFVALGRSLKNSQKATRSGEVVARLATNLHGAEQEIVRRLGSHLSLPCIP